ncbi:hypothetical protein HAX54_036219 [Datura stramonium]|uniref:RNase H type-1 domain-containing protein n=1 Tax=Datura stramonium TaxID=4076 RepID=A0ABS8VKF1_DATST|nr:hypothetical protein [Datura stramonium]
MVRGSIADELEKIIELLDNLNIQVLHVTREGNQLVDHLDGEKIPTLPDCCGEVGVIIVQRQIKLLVWKKFMIREKTDHHVQILREESMGALVAHSIERLLMDRTCIDWSYKGTKRFGTHIIWCVNDPEATKMYMLLANLLVDNFARKEA